MVNRTKWLAKLFSANCGFIVSPEKWIISMYFGEIWPQICARTSLCTRGAPCWFPVWWRKRPFHWLRRWFKSQSGGALHNWCMLMAGNMKVYIFVKIRSGEMESCPIKDGLLSDQSPGLEKHVWWRLEICRICNLWQNLNAEFEILAKFECTICIFNNMEQNLLFSANFCIFLKFVFLIIWSRICYFRQILNAELTQ